MPVPDLGSAPVAPFDPRRRAPLRDPWRGSSPRRPTDAVASASHPVEPAFPAPVVVPDLSRLTFLHEAPPARPSVSVGEQAFYHHLDRLIAAIREGDLARARAIVETLETQMLVERSAGHALPASRSLEPPPAPGQAVDAVYETLVHYLATDEPTY